MSFKIYKIFVFYEIIEKYAIYAGYFYSYLQKCAKSKMNHKNLHIAKRCHLYIQNYAR